MARYRYTTLRLWSMLKKEFRQIRRDYLTYAFLILIPFLEVLLFGYIINTDPKHLPTVVLSYDSSPFTNSLIESLKNTEYFNIKQITNDRVVADKLMHKEKVLFIINFPENFSRDLIKKKSPHLLIEGDGTDPVAVSNAFHAAKMLGENGLEYDFQGPLKSLQAKNPSFYVDTQAKFNPTLRAQYHTLPGLLVALLTITLVMITAISITIEYERGTLELLLVTPIKASEVILGKIIPHIILGYTLFFLALMVCRWVFGVPFYGSLLLLTLVAMPFFIANLGIGLAASTFSKTQFRAANLANLYYLPAILLSGFMFPFYGMPKWAQNLGNLLPTTHFLRIITGIMLKGSTFTEIWGDLWPILVFMVVIVFISFKYYRKTLD